MAKRQRQTPEDQLAAFMRLAYGSGRNSEINNKEFNAAAERIGLKDKDRLDWAVRFAQEPFEKMSAGDRINAQIEIGAFLQPSLGLETRSIPFVAALFPSPELVAEIKSEFLALIQSASLKREHSFPATQMQIGVGPNGISYKLRQHITDPRELERGQIELAKLQLAKLLGSHWGYVGLCDPKQDGCGRYFRKSRIDRQFCSDTCLNRSTTYRQRRKGGTA
jgi:hypothetical protein